MVPWWHLAATPKRLRDGRRSRSACPAELLLQMMIKLVCMCVQCLYNYRFELTDFTYEYVTRVRTYVRTVTCELQLPHAHAYGTVQCYPYSRVQLHVCVFV